MQYVYQTEGVCSQAIRFDIDGDVISNIEFSAAVTEISKPSQSFVTE